MQSLMKINGAWKEGTPYLKESGTWKECNVTAKANGKWADIAPPKPVGKTWTEADFDYDGHRGYTIKPEVRQYFQVGDTFNFRFDKVYSGLKFTTTPVPGLMVGTDSISSYISGTITGGVDLTDVMNFKGSSLSSLKWFKIKKTDGYHYIPIKPAP